MTNPLLPADPVADHDCLLRASDVIERLGETLSIMAQGNEAHRVLWDEIKADALRLRQMAARLGRTIPPAEWFKDAQKERS